MRINKYLALNLNISRREADKIIQNKQIKINGINAELGYIFFLQEQYDQAIVYLKKEKLTYPESTKFIDDFLQNLNEG